MKKDVDMNDSDWVFVYVSTTQNNNNYRYYYYLLPRQWQLRIAYSMYDISNGDSD